MSRVLCPGDVFTLYDDVLIFVCCVEKESATGMLAGDISFDSFVCKSLKHAVSTQLPLHSKIETIKRIRNVTHNHVGLKDAKEVADMLTDTGPRPGALADVWRAP